MSEGLFRKEALEDAASRGNLTKSIRRIPINMKIAGLILLIIVISLLIWMVWGNVAEVGKMKGLVFPQGGIKVVSAPEDGNLSEVLIQQGEAVEQGQVIALMRNDTLLQQIDSAMNKENSDPAQIEALRSAYRASSFLVSDSRGRVLSAKRSGAYVSLGEPVARIIVESQTMDDKKILAFVTTSQANRFQLGMEAQVSPDFAPREQYGYMEGYISDIDSFPRDIRSIEEEYGLFIPEDSTSGNNNYVKIEITLIADSHAANQIKWSNPKGEGLTIEPGVNCDILIVIKNLRPYQWLLS